MDDMSEKEFRAWLMMAHIRCTNCGATRLQMEQWLLMQRQARVNWFLNQEQEWKSVVELLPSHRACCEEPYALGQTEVPYEELVYRALPRGEDR